VTKTLAESERQGRILRGEGDAEAAKLFADAFSQDRTSMPLSVACVHTRIASRATRM
jgi:regulator of protease activity HflC (stomatin/prohibitin superfamily)